MDKELQASGRCILAHYLYTPLLYLRRLRYLQLKSVSKGFWMFLEVLSSCIRGVKALNKLKNTRKTQFFHLKKSFVLLFFCNFAARQWNGCETIDKNFENSCRCKLY